jgi:hypothetical protein
MINGRSAIRTGILYLTPGSGLCHSRSVPAGVLSLHDFRENPMLIFVVWGWTVRRHRLDSGRFYCPTCAARREYHNVRIAEHFCLFLIPLGESKDLGRGVECAHCNDLFDPDILEHGEDLELQHAHVAVRFRLQLGATYDQEIERLIRQGIAEELAIDIVLSAVALNEELKRPDDAPEGNFVSCLSCSSRLELLDQQIRNQRFICPICDIRWQFH